MFVKVKDEPTDIKMDKEPTSNVRNQCEYPEFNSEFEIKDEVKNIELEKGSFLPEEKRIFLRVKNELIIFNVEIGAKEDKDEPIKNEKIVCEKHYFKVVVMRKKPTGCALPAPTISTSPKLVVRGVVCCRVRGVV